MPVVQRTGVYRNADGHSFFLRRDRIMSDEVAASYALDPGAALSESRQAIADADNAKAPVAFVGLEPRSWSTPRTSNDGGEAPVGLDGDANADTGVSRDPVEAREVSTASYPASVDEPSAEASAEVAPNKRRSRKPKDVATPEDKAQPIATPEDKAPAHEERD